MVAILGLLLSLSIILGYVEFLIFPDITIPGVKIGLSNICVMYTVYKYDYKCAYLIGVLKVLLSSVLFSGVQALMFGLFGMLLSISVMLIFKMTKKFSIFGISMIGGVFHNIGQLIVAVAITDTSRLMYYAPVLLIAGLICGCLIGIVCNILIKIG